MPVGLIHLPKEIDGSEITLKWKEPPNNGANISGYTVYKRIVSKDEWERSPVGKTCEHLIKLNRGKTYEFKVTATNMRGESLKGRQVIRKVTVLGKLK